MARRQGVEPCPAGFGDQPLSESQRNMGRSSGIEPEPPGSQPGSADLYTTAAMLFFVAAAHLASRPTPKACWEPRSLTLLAAGRVPCHRDVLAHDHGTAILNRPGCVKRAAHV
jgi:hypothetical protein